MVLSSLHEVLRPYINLSHLQILGITLLVVFFRVLYYSRETWPQVDAPCLTDSSMKQRKRWSWDSSALLLEGYRKFYGKVFQVFTNDGPMVLVPYEMINEVKALPDTILSARAGVADAFQSKYTMLPMFDGDFGVDFLKSTITQNLDKFLPDVQEELDYVFIEHFTDYKEWTPVAIHPKLLSIIGSTTARILVGPKQCRDPNWLKTVMVHSRDLFIAATILKLFPGSLRPLIQYFIPAIWRIHSHVRVAVKVVLAALEEEEAESRRTAARHIFDLLPDHLRKDYKYQGKLQLGLTAAATHSTANLLANCIYDLAAHPEYIPILRGEIELNLDLSGGQYSVEMLAGLKKLDSFMRETLRTEGAAGTVAARRKVLQPITLSDGTRLPKNSYIAFPLQAISNDPAFHDDPDTFDGLRSYKLRQRSEEDKSRHQLVSLDNKNLMFGTGRHACPGRFFANLEGKLLLSKLLLKYDFKLKDREERPKDLIYAAMRVGMPSEILVRDRMKAWSENGVFRPEVEEARWIN